MLCNCALPDDGSVRSRNMLEFMYFIIIVILMNFLSLLLSIAVIES